MILKNLKIIALTTLIIYPINIFEGNKLFVRDKFASDSVVTGEYNNLQGLSSAANYSNKRLGSFIEEGKTYFRLFTPNAVKVVLSIFRQPEDREGVEYTMKKDEDGVWDTELEGELNGLYYGYKVYHDGDDLSNTDKAICVDPYAKAVASYTTYFNPRRSIVYEGTYDWEGDSWIQRDWRDLIIYEMHLRDMTAHPSSGAEHRGTYSGLTERGIRGGLDYIKSLGANTVELLPVQEFGNIEIPFEDSASGRFNSWNPYERNHWGYMTAAYFAPEAYYSEDWEELKWKTWMGKGAKQVNDFKDLVKTFHREGIAVIMDVVYNHLSEYETGNLKEIDKGYYFRLDTNGNYISQSYCGNDLKTETPMMRRLIIESVLYWMKEYHIDGFRFDLGKLIDWETIEEIIREARKINPNVIFVCEPWGGGYDPKGFSLRDWGSWNDQIRNGIKGENPYNGLGWIFGKWYGNNDAERIKSYINGTLIRDKYGLFQKKEHSVNYLESHDGYTLGDFIRIGTKEVDPKKTVKDLAEHIKLTPLQTRHNKLAALFLFTCQGITMIHEGQEFARSKVIFSDPKIEDNQKGLIDHNSYDKDNETNYINYHHAEINKNLLNYYRGLIELRNTYSAFRHAHYEDIKFYELKNNPFALAYSLDYKDQHFFVVFNAHRKKNAIFTLPEGNWEILVSGTLAGIHPLGDMNGSIGLEPITGGVLMKKSR